MMPTAAAAGAGR